jgi:hypothetical protein
MMLELRFDRGEGASSNISIPMMSDDASAQSELVGKTPSDILGVPLPITGHGVVSGWVLFKLHEKILSNVGIESYKLKVVDTQNIEASLEILVMQEQG